MQNLINWIRRKPGRTAVIVVVGIVIVGCIGNPWIRYKYGLLLRTHGDYLKARQLWDAHPVERYRLTMSRVAPYYEWGGPGCFQDVEVISEQVVKTDQDSCSSQGVFRPMADFWTPPNP